MHPWGQNPLKLIGSNRGPEATYTEHASNMSEKPENRSKSWARNRLDLQLRDLPGHRFTGTSGKRANLEPPDFRSWGTSCRAANAAEMAAYDPKRTHGMQAQHAAKLYGFNLT